MTIADIRKPPFWASFFTLLAFLILCGLGTWQVVRLQWKTDLLHKMERAYETDVQETRSYGELRESIPYERVRVQGSYLPEYQIMVGPRPYDGRVGFHVVVPFALRDRDGNDEGYILVNRGWSEDKNYTTPFNRDVAVTGMLRDPARLVNRLAPDNIPAQNQWFDIDLPQIQKATGLTPLVPFVLYADKEQPDDGRLDKKPLRWHPPNNHLSYAVFWFATAATLLVIFFLRFMRSPAGVVDSGPADKSLQTTETGSNHKANDKG